MVRKILLCEMNVSEGIDMDKINAIAAELKTHRVLP